MNYDIPVRTLFLIFSTFLGGCDHAPPAHVVQPDTRPAFALDPSKSFVVEFGRGSGWHGLDIIKVDHSGTVKVSRTTNDHHLESASLKLSRLDLAKLVGLVNTNKLTSLGRTYTDPRIADGTQWVLWIQQGVSEKAIYFNNSFPDEITAFANGLDALLKKAGLNSATWNPVPTQQGIDQQNALWARIEPKR
jgi:hypothetical protein